MILYKVQLSILGTTYVYFVNFSGIQSRYKRVCIYGHLANVKMRIFPFLKLQSRIWFSNYQDDNICSCIWIACDLDNFRSPVHTTLLLTLDTLELTEFSEMVSPHQHICNKCFISLSNIKIYDFFSKTACGAQTVMLWLADTAP